MPANLVAESGGPDSAHIQFISEGKGRRNTPEKPCRSTWCTPLTKVIMSLCLGLLMSIMGLVSYTTFGPILEQQVKANLVIDPSNEVYESWQSAPVPIYAKFYLFNFTNYKEVLAHREKPKLQQLGPYTYRERRKKVGIKFNENGTVSYSQVVSYEFLPGMSNGSLDDLVTTLNVPMIGSAYRVRKDEVSEKIQAEYIESMFDGGNYTIFIQRTAEELLFKGYDDRLMAMASDANESKFRKFGYLFGRNNSNDGVYTVFTGSSGMDKYGHVDNWEGRQRVAGFRKPCSVIRGTTGEMWPPYSITADKNIVIFISQLCRSLNLTFLREDVVKGIKVLRYHINEKIFSYDNEQNQCYCYRKHKGAKPLCFPNGVLDLNRCQPDAPFVLSLPHFMHADASYIESVDGVEPREDIHDFFMDIEPTMGIPVQVSARLQMNVILSDFKYFKAFEGFRQQFLPTFWTETSATVNDEMASRIRLVTEDLANYVTLACFASILIGLVVIMCTLAFVIAYTRKAKMNRPSLTGYSAVKLVKPSRKGGRNLP